MTNIQTILESTHFVRTITDKFNKRNKEAPLYKQDLKFIIRNCTKKLHLYDLSKRSYHSPMDLISKYKNVLTDDVLHALQSVNMLYQQTTKTHDTKLFHQIITKLMKHSKIYKYLLTFTKFIASNFDAPFDLITLDLLRPGNTFHDWSKPENQCKFNVINNNREYTITYPAGLAPITVYRNLLNATFNHDSYRVQQSCIQSERSLQYQLVGWFLLSIYFIYFFVLLNNNIDFEQKKMASR